MTSAATSKPTERSRGPFWLLLAVFFVPLGLAFALYYGLPNWRPTGTSSHGDLISPARRLPELPFKVGELGKEPQVDPKFWEGKWSLLYTGPAECDARCEQALHDIRQVRLALNQDMPRVQRVFVPVGECCAEARFNGQEGLLIAQLPPEELKRFYAAFPVLPEGDPASAGRIYIVDPLSNLMMSYSATAPADGMLKDLKKLLKLSHIG
jgi:cytochrome oxidase Cu insertion factor (SCO1/SenC/PrrC family)